MAGLVGDTEPNGHRILPIEPRTLLRFSRVGLFGGDDFGETSSVWTSVVSALEGSGVGVTGVSRGTETSSGSMIDASTVFCFEDSTVGVGGGRCTASVSVIF